MLSGSHVEPLQVDPAESLQVTSASVYARRMSRMILGTLFLIGLVACSSESTGTSGSTGNSSGTTSSGASGSTGTSSGTTSSTSGSSSSSKFSCKLNGTCYKCPSSDAVLKCTKDVTTSGCTSTDVSFCN